MQDVLDQPPAYMHGFGATTPKTLWPNAAYAGRAQTDDDRLVMGLFSRRSSTSCYVWPTNEVYDQTER